MQRSRRCNAAAPQVTLPTGSLLLFTCTCSQEFCCLASLNSKFWVSHHPIFLFSPGLQKSLLSKDGVAEQQGIAGRVAGGLHLTATHRKETIDRKNQSFAGRGEAPALPEALSNPSLGHAACRARIRPWLSHRAASQDRVEINSGCGATVIILHGIFN